MMTFFEGTGGDTGRRTGLGAEDKICFRHSELKISLDKYRNKGLRGDWIYESELQGTNLSWRFESPTCRHYLGRGHE